MSRRIALGVCALMFAATTVSATAGRPGDCDGSGLIDVAELTLSVGIVLGQQPLTSCSGTDSDRDGGISVAEMVAIVSDFLTQPLSCGNSYRDLGEQCDDGGFLGGDGCSATCQLEGTGVLDQYWLGSTPGCAGSYGAFNPAAGGPVGQEFRPTLASISSVSVGVVSTVGSGESRASAVRLTIHAEQIDGPVVATVDDIAEPPAGTYWAYHRFELPHPVAVTPGALYVLRFDSDAGVAWVEQAGEADCLVRSYPGGDSIFPAGRGQGSDFHFAVFGLVE